MFLAFRFTSTETDPPISSPTPFTRSEGGQLNNQCGLPRGCGKELGRLLPLTLFRLL